MSMQSEENLRALKVSLYYCGICLFCVSSSVVGLVHCLIVLTMLLSLNVCRMIQKLTYLELVLHYFSRPVETNLSSFCSASPDTCCIVSCINVVSI